MSPKNSKLADSLAQMRAGAEQLAEVAASFVNAVDDVCGTPCQDIVDGSGTAVCAVTWAEGCGDVPPPPGFSGESTVGQLCKSSCAVTLMGAMPAA